MADLELPIQPNVLSQDCASRRALELVSEKWTALVVYALVGGPKRHAELLRMIEGISQKMLTQTLRRMEYRLSGLGRTLAEPLVALCRWAMDHLDEVRDARAVHGAPML
jgi:DNA-binding HxlR family transcriptional regulator